MKQMFRATITAGLLFVIAVNSYGGEQIFKSGTARIGLLELYTSEGCSSCPPADTWFSSLEQSDGLWSRWVPVAFHVDYWDDLGWPDRFATAEFSQRQRNYARQGGLSAVYTPGLVYKGQEWRMRRGIPPIDSSEYGNPGEIFLKVSDGQAEIQYLTSAEASQLAMANVAILGFNINTQVARGENRGRTLHHDFVVLSLQQQSLVWRDGALAGVIKLSKHKLGTNRLAIAAWVSRPPALTPVQAVGGWLSSAP